MLNIEQIRQELTWKLRRDVLYPAEMIHDMGLQQDDDAVHFGAFKNDKLAGVVSLFQNGNDFQFRKLAVDPSVQNMGIGSALLMQLINYALENGGTRIWCNARTPAIGFYMKAGFMLTGGIFEKKNVHYAIMEKILVA